MRSKGLALCLAACASVTAFACSSNSHSSVSNQDITSIPETPVTDQGETGSCWLYATANWVESLHTEANGSSIHYSPAYWLYWEFYDQLLAGGTAVVFGGYWGRAADIIQRYGLMPLGSFEIDDVASALAALDTLNEKVQSGALGAPGSPPNPVLVRAALDDAFNLGNDTRALLTQTFGADGTHTFQTGAAASGALIRAKDVRVKSPSPGRGLTSTTLDVLLGGAKPGGESPDDRTGAGAWTAVYPPVTAGLTNVLMRGERPGGRPLFRTPAEGDAATSQNDSGNSDFQSDAGGNDLLADSGAARASDAGPAPNPIAGLPPLTAPDPFAWRAYWKRIQRAMNDGVPVPMAWMVIDRDIDAKGHFRAGSPVVAMSMSGGHEVILTDYEINNVPGFGTLGVGTPTTAAQKMASLDDHANISFFRVKNSWGNDVRVTGFQNLAGYNDIDVSYLQQPIDWCDDSSPDGGAASCTAIAPQVWDVVLPPGY